MLIQNVWQAVTDAGVDMVPVDARHVELRRGRRSVLVEVHQARRPLGPRAVARLIARTRETGLLVVPSATEAARRTLDDAGWSWLVTGATGVRGAVRLGPTRVEVGRQPDAEPTQVQARTGPVPWGSFTVVRLLLLLPAATQRVLAEAGGLSQPRVSQVLTQLEREQLVKRRPAGWMVDDFDGLLRWWLERYPGPGGISTYWYGLESPVAQAQAVVGHLGGRSGGTDSTVVVSGDVAADQLAPWRAPGRAVVYARAGADLTAVGLTPAGAAEATTELIVPEDPGLWPKIDCALPAADVTATASGAVPLANPIQVLWDVRRAPGADSGEAAERLWAVLRERSRAVHGQG
jgi:hypothetical protein